MSWRADELEAENRQRQRRREARLTRDFLRAEAAESERLQAAKSKDTDAAAAGLDGSTGDCTPPSASPKRMRPKRKVAAAAAAPDEDFEEDTEEEYVEEGPTKKKGKKNSGAVALADAHQEAFLPENNASVARQQRENTLRVLQNITNKHTHRKEIIKNTVSGSDSPQRVTWAVGCTRRLSPCRPYPTRRTRTKRQGKMCRGHSRKPWHTRCNKDTKGDTQPQAPTLQQHMLLSWRYEPFVEL